MIFEKGKAWDNNLSVDKYLKEISKHKVLTSEEEVTLIQRIRQGDKKAFKRMIECNLKFVVKVANEYKGQGLPLEDLINEGNLGLIKALDKFDETKGFKFISYAVWWIRQSIMQALNEQTRIIRLPGNRLDHISKVSKAIRDFESEFHRVPTTEELSSTLNISMSDVIIAAETGTRSVSLNTPIGQGEEGGYLIEMIADKLEDQPDKALLDEALKQNLRGLLQGLNEKERLVIKLYFGIDQENCLTLEDIGDMLNLTRERVRQIKEKALRKLKNSTEIRQALI